MTRTQRTLSDKKGPQCSRDRKYVSVKVTVLGLMLLRAAQFVVAQPADTSQNPRKVLPSDPVGNLFNDGPRVVYTQESGADPIERLFWDRELKKEKLMQQMQPVENKISETTIEQLKEVPFGEEQKVERASSVIAIDELKASNGSMLDEKSEHEGVQPISRSNNTEKNTNPNIQSKHARKHSETRPQELKRAADAGRLDGVQINGAQWPVNKKPQNNYGKPRGGGRPWQGLVFNVPLGTEVKAIDAGRVMYANNFKNYGNLVIIDHGDRVASVYANNQKLFVKEGDSIGTGDLIALSGQTGSLDHPALYFEIRKEGKPVDPLQFLKRQ